MTLHRNCSTEVVLVMTQPAFMESDPVEVERRESFFMCDSTAYLLLSTIVTRSFHAGLVTLSIAIGQAVRAAAVSCGGIEIGVMVLIAIVSQR
jgi:hypothetical protein